MPAPLGYRNVGSGQPKEPDPKTASLVRHLFELYSTGTSTFRDLQTEAERIGLRGRSNKPVSKNGLTTLLNNPFYAGLIHIKASNQSFMGAHEPLISKALFDRVQDVLHGRVNARTSRHDFLFRRRLTCKGCGHTLIGETHKGFIYYRCQTRLCPNTAVREEVAEKSFAQTFLAMRLSRDEREYCGEKARHMRAERLQQTQNAIKSLNLAVAQLDERVNRLTDAYIDRLIDRDTFEQRKTALLSERLLTMEALTTWEAGKRNIADEFMELLERADSAYSAYKSGIVVEKREMVDSLTSNRLLNGKSLEISLVSPFDRIASRYKTSDGSPRRDVHRTWGRLIPLMMAVLKRQKEEQEQLAA